VRRSFIDTIQRLDPFDGLVLKELYAATGAGTLSLIREISSSHG
jgi:hypothetical protein